jgi:hypothetical protein
MPAESESDVFEFRWCVSVRPHFAAQSGLSRVSEAGIRHVETLHAHEDNNLEFIRSWDHGITIGFLHNITVLFLSRNVIGE